MSKEYKILIAGFGGQGILFSGKFLVYAGMIKGREVTWLPSYGPEMRGGTASCAVIISDAPVGSPMVTDPSVLIVMNTPSYDRYEGAVSAGGCVIVDSSIVERPPTRTDVDTFRIPATAMCAEHGLVGLANMVMVGKLIRETGVCNMDDVADAMRKSVPERKKDLFESNIKAIELGYNFDQDG